MAGIAAAYVLSKNGVRVSILESSNYIGGRIKKITFDNETFEAGANWIQGLQNEDGNVNDLWKIAQEKNLQGHLDPD